MELFAARDEDRKEWRQKLVESAPRRASMTGLEGVGDLDLGTLATSS